MTRLGEALAELSAAGIHPPRTSALDALTAPADAQDATEPADILSDLLTAEPAVGLAPEDERDVLLLDRMKREKTRHEKAAATLGKDIERVQTRLIELGVELGLIDKRGRLALGAVDDGHGFLVSPYEVRTIWPKYRDDPETDQPYTRDQLIEVLKANGLGRLVVETTAQYDYPGYVRDRVKAWRQAAGQAGVRDDQGRYVDLDGEPLTGSEAQDPVADIFALPRAVRAVIEPVDKIALQFTRRRVDPAPPPEVDPSDPVARLLAEAPTEAGD